VLVFVDPANEAARLLCANVLEPLDYQAESGPWRNAYLTAALELHYGNQCNSTGLQKGGSIAMQMTLAMIFDYMGILMDKEAMAEQGFTINVTLCGDDHPVCTEHESGGCAGTSAVKIIEP